MQRHHFASHSTSLDFFMKVFGSVHAVLWSVRSFVVVCVAIVYVLVPSGVQAGASYSLLGTNTYVGGGTNTISTTGSVSWSTGDVLIMTFSSNQFYANSGTGSACDGFFTVSGTPNVTWSGVACGATGNVRNTLVLKGIANASGSGTITATQVTGTFEDLAMSIVKISGLQTNTPIINASVTNDYTNPEATSFPKTANGSTYMGIVTTEGNTTFSPFTGWTELSDVFSGSSVSQTVNYRTTYDTTTSCGATASAESFSTIICLEIGDPLQSANTIKAPNNLGLVGYWSFNDATGTIATDFSGYKRDGTLSSFSNPATATSGWGPGKAGGALRFDGVDDSVSTADIQFPSGNFTVSVWLKSSSPGTIDQAVISKNSGFTNSNYEIFFNSDYLAGTLNDDSFQESDVSCDAGNGLWHLATMVVTDSTVTMYCDAIAGTPVSFDGSIPTNTNAIQIGSDVQGSNKFNGSLDEVRVYNRALSVSEIVALYKSGITTNRQISNQGLIGYWPMNEGTSTSVGDASGSGNNGSFVNTPTWTNGKIGKGVNLNIYTSYIQIPDNSVLDTTSSVTISAWVKFSPYIVGDVQSLVTKDGNYALEMNAGHVRMKWWAGTDIYMVEYTPSPAFSAGEWHHLVGVATGNLPSALYIDGLLVATSPSVLSGGVSRNLTNPLYFGGGAGYGFQGVIDDVRIYNRALSTAEASSLYRVSERAINTSQNNKVASGLVGMWSFNGQDMDWANNIAYDRSGQGNNGTVSNMTQSISIDVGKVGQALRFNTNTSITIPANASLRPATNLTVSAWVKSTHDIGSTYERIVDQRYSKGYVLCLNGAITGNADTIGAAMLAMGSNNGGDAVLLGGTTNIANDNTWHLVTGTFDNGVMKIYVDGVLENSTTAGFSTVLYNSDSPTIGYDNSTGSNSEHFVGSIDEVRVYNRTLTAAEILQLYRLGR